MEFRRRYVKLDRSPEEQARIDGLRERFQRERPSLNELVESGEFEPPISQGEYFDMVEMLVSLRTAREQARLSQKIVASRMGVDADFLAALETGKEEPTMDILRQYAGALGKQIVLSLADIPQASSTDSVELH